MAACRANAEQTTRPQILPGGRDVEAALLQPVSERGVDKAPSPSLVLTPATLAAAILPDWVHLSPGLGSTCHPGQGALR